MSMQKVSEALILLAILRLRHKWTTDFQAIRLLLH